MSLEFLVECIDSDREIAHDEHRTMLREIGSSAEVLTDIIKDAVETGFAETGPEIAGLRALADSVLICGTLIANQILVKKLTAIDDREKRLAKT